jgi:sec-independent protein translocase protein TatA
MELLILLLIILLFFGAGRVPQVGRSLGRSLREFRKEVSQNSEKDDELPKRNESEEAPPRGEAPPEEARAQREHEEVYTEQPTEQKS